LGEQDAAHLGAAADEIERLRAALSDVRSYLRDKKTWHAPPTAEQLADTVLDMLEAAGIDLT